ncbi:hypothetical protein Hanom_Chr12g01144011 [Helianthus anomalus]
MALPYKTPHNYLGLLEKPSHTETFNSIIDALSSSKYKTLLTYDAPIYLDTQQEFWKNAKLETKDKKPLAITSSIKGISVKITPQTILEVLELDVFKVKLLSLKQSIKLIFLREGMKRK